jgi:uncharacterized protein YerC
VKWTVAENEERLRQAKALIDEGRSYGSVMREVSISRATLIKHFGYSSVQAPRHDDRVKIKVKSMIDMGYSYHFIEKECGVTQSTITRWYGPSPFPKGYNNREHNRNRKYTEEQYEEAIRLRMMEGKTNSEIIEITGISRDSIQRMMGGTPRRLGGVKPWAEGRKQRVLYLASAGWSASKISLYEKIPRSTVSEWIMKDKLKQAAAATKVAQFRAGDNNIPSNITDHKFEHTPSEPWGRCIACGMAEAAHAESAVYYEPDGDWRCPNCVTADVKICGHNHETWYEDAMAINEEMSDSGRAEQAGDKPAGDSAIDLGGPGDVRSSANESNGQPEGSFTLGDS